jgi:hypothetical protein
MKVNPKYTDFDYLLSTAIAVLACINIRRWQFYLAGRFNLGRFFLLFSLSYWLIILLIICLLALIAIRVLRNCRKPEIRERFKKLLMLLFLVSVLVFAFTRRGYPFADTYLRGFRQRMLVQADITAIRAWLSEASDYKNGDIIPPSSWPQAVKKLSPYNLKFWSCEDIRLTWNGQLGNQWGLVVRLSSMDIPDSELGRYWMSLSDWGPSHSFWAYVWFQEGK